MKPDRESKPEQKSLIGLAYATPAFLIWGLSPIYWNVLSNVAALEIIMHRVIWSFLFLLPILFIRRRWKEFTTAFKNKKTLLILICTTFFVSCNWLVYIWAVTHDRVLQASLGYYISPLINVLLALIFLRERLRPFQIVAVGLAGTGVIYLTIYYGEFPWVALTLGFSFGLYGLIRKVAAVGSLAGLSVEMLILALPALAYLLYLDKIGVGSFFHINKKIDLFLVGSALVTAVPLLLFTLGTRRLHLSTVGILQYIAPSCMFLLAVFHFREPIVAAQVLTFVMIWMALCIYSADAMLFNKSRAQDGLKIRI
jgi:chloramphenicol-sensitive protein RarD